MAFPSQQMQWPYSALLSLLESCNDNLRTQTYELPCWHPSATVLCVSQSGKYEYGTCNEVKREGGGGGRGGVRGRGGGIPAFWDVMLFHQTSLSQYFKGICHLIFKGSRSSKNTKWSQVVGINKHSLTSGC
jgi:hypothetical protein